MDELTRYADAFGVDRGRQGCWRYIYADYRHGRPGRCPGEVWWAGVYETIGDRRRVVVRRTPRRWKKLDRTSRPRRWGRGRRRPPVPAALTALELRDLKPGVWEVRGCPNGGWPQTSISSRWLAGYWSGAIGRRWSGRSGGRGSGDRGFKCPQSVRSRCPRCTDPGRGWQRVGSVHLAASPPPTTGQPSGSSTGRSWRTCADVASRTSSTRTRTMPPTTRTPPSS